MSLKKEEGFLTRSGLRDVVLLLSAASAFFCPLTAAGTGVALFLLLLGSFIHFLTKGVLIRNEVLCREGIYGVVRHPYYLANYLIDSSFCVLSGNRYLLLLYPFLFFWSYGPTFRKEEGTLTAMHGDASVDYVLGTPPVFPDRHSVRNARPFAGFSWRRISGKEVARITRFYAMTCIILVIHRKAPGAADLSFLRLPGTLALLSLAALLYAAGLVILKLRKRKSDRA
jgi:hypothetical protein